MFISDVANKQVLAVELLRALLAFIRPIKYYLILYLLVLGMASLMIFLVAERGEGLRAELANIGSLASVSSEMDL
jgi:hypothetical protein